MRKAAPVSFFDNRLKVYTALLLPALLVYYKSLSFGFTVLDEQWMIMENTAFLSHWEGITKAFSDAVAKIYYRPLFMITLVCDYHLGKLSPFSYHVTNLLLHLFATALLYRLFAFFDVQKRTAFILAILFSLHPVMLHAVVWVPGRNDLLLCVFVLLSLIALNNYIVTSKNKFMVLHLLFFVCALFTKESAIVLPLLYTANIYLFQPLKKNKAFYLLLGMWIAFGVAWLALRSSVVGPAAGDTHVSEVMKNIVPAFLLFVGKTILPLQQSVFPTLKEASLIPGVVTLALLVLLWFKPGVVNKKTALFGILIFVVMLAIPLWFGAAKSGGEHYEHRLYTSMAGLVLFMSQVKFNWNSKGFLYTAIAIGLVYAVRTSLRMNVYKNKEVFVEYGMKEAPGYYLFYHQKAEMLSGKGDYRAALPYCDKAISLRPDKAELYNNRGVAYFNLGMNVESLPDFIKAISLSKREPRYYLNRCAAYHVAHDTVMAMHDLVVMRELRPEIIPQNVELAVTDGWAILVDRYNRKLAADPQNARLYYERALLYYRINMDVNGAADLKKAAELDPSNALYKQQPVLEEI